MNINDIPECWTYTDRAKQDIQALLDKYQNYSNSELERLALVEIMKVQDRYRTLRHVAVRILLESRLS